MKRKELKEESERTSMVFLTTATPTSSAADEEDHVDVGFVIT